MSVDISKISPVAIYRDTGLQIVPDTAALIPNGTQADERLAVDNTVGGVQFAAFHADTINVFWTSEDAGCRVTFDNSAPTATNGHLILPGSSGIWSKPMAVAAKFIRTNGMNAIVHASQLK